MERVAVEGAELAVYERGSGTPAFVFIHGGACDHRAWTPQLDALSNTNRCLTIDLRGCGRSDAVPPYDVEQQAEDVAAVIRARVGGAAILVGHSLGGFTALLVNELAPDLVSGIVTIDTPLGPRFAGTDGLADAIRAAESLEPFAEHVERMVAGSNEDVAGLVREMMLGCQPDVVAGMLSNLGPVAERLESLVKAADRKPFMTLWPISDGADADQSPSAAAPAWLREVTMFARQEPVVVDGGGHFLQLENPAVTNALLRAFVDDVERDPRANP